MRSVMRCKSRTRHIVMVEPALLVDTLRGKDGSLDRRIEALSQEIMLHPEKYLTSAQVTAFRQVVDSETGEMKKDIADRLGYERASSLSMMLRRIYDRLGMIDVEDYQGEIDFKDE